jgi:hypothetical protein
MNFILNNKIKFDKNKYNPVNEKNLITMTSLTRNKPNTMQINKPIEIDKNFSTIPSSKLIDFKLKNYKANSLNLSNLINPSINPLNKHEVFNHIMQKKRIYENNYYKTDEIIINICGNSESELNNKTLYDFLLELSKNLKIKIYIYTWNIDKSIVEYYFQGLNVVSIIIDQSPSNNLKTIFSSNKTLSSWKMIWTGMFRSMNEIYKTEDNNTIILNSRFDINYKFNMNDILKLSVNKFTKNIFLKDSTDLSGVDNPIIGDKHTLYKLVNSFYNNLQNVTIMLHSLLTLIISLA